MGARMLQRSMQLGARIYFALGASVFLTVLTAQYLALLGLVKLAARVIFFLGRFYNTLQ